MCVWIWDQALRDHAFPGVYFCWWSAEINTHGNDKQEISLISPHVNAIDFGQVSLLRIALSPFDKSNYSGPKLLYL